MDLTTSYPRSVRDKLFGLVQIGRTIDKGKATAEGKNGEYHYNCPMDQAVFAFLGIDHDALLDVIKNAKNDEAIDAYVKTFIDKKSPQEIEAWNKEWLSHEPDNDDSRKYFVELRNQVAPDRTDVTTWADILDLDEKRNVPKRQPVSA
ncbi:MAG TPA: DUF5069 domain-containing protein [Verrucomicrobiae bacterium]|nr:DUF5069 domain-containing protein [Verrucomicrobiae bacterium]